MRTVEVLFVIMILLSAFVITSQFAVLPSPRDAFGTNLRDLSQSTLETLDQKGVLSETVFSDSNDDVWGDLQKALSASLPVNVVYNLSIYDIIESGGVVTYQLAKSISDASLGTDSDSASLLVASPDVTYTKDIEKIGSTTGQEITLYIMNCEDANGWWITGYTGQSLATELYNLLSPYFTTTVLINDTNDLELLLENSTSLDGTIQNAVIMNPFGEAVPIPANYTQGKPQSSEGYYLVDNGFQHQYYDTYSKYCYTLGVKTRQYNWTWVSIVGYPFYYVSNTGVFAESDNGYGVHGMIQVGPAGLLAFLRGLDNKAYNDEGGAPVWQWKYVQTEWQSRWVYLDEVIPTYPDGSIYTDSIATDIDVVQFTDNALDKCNYYGIYPAPSPTASRALPTSIESAYNLNWLAPVFELKSSCSAAATYYHTGGGALTTIGLTRIPDARVSALALLVYYQPNVYRSNFGDRETSRLVTLQLGQQGGA